MGLWWKQISKSRRVWSPRFIIIMGKCPNSIWRNFSPPQSVSTENQKAAPPHVLPREPRATCGRVLLCWRERRRGEKGGRERGRQLCSEAQLLTGFMKPDLVLVRWFRHRICFILCHSFPLNFSFSCLFNCLSPILMIVMGFTYSCANFLLWQLRGITEDGVLQVFLHMGISNIIVFLGYPSTK